ncbi:uncharacterized protein LOC132047781 [Lycium ferocissimum]|uniref:uncharacterized protein LOC132047781 n=1 Tax=Lycium ferocissimum TaxID=112874 RepID=UPI002815B2BB|nr:uncharacterized protein LOC132047781 [Lycium ferocissimum]
MAFYGYNDDAGECHWTPNFSVPYDYDAFPTQSSISYSSYGYSNSEQIEQSTNYNYYYTNQMHPELSYSVHNSTEPIVIQYEKGANSLETRTITSCSTKEQDDTVFEEYDPTPYGGGYDMAQTYGKPLLPSNEICYPPSIPEPNRLPLDGFDYGTIRSPYVNHGDKVEKPQDQSKEIDVKDEQKSLSGLQEKDILEKPIEQPQQDQDFVVGNGTTGGKTILEDDILEKPVEPPQQDQDFVIGNGTIGEYGYDYGRQLQQIPYGSGLEAMDICECLFGYWPCIAKETQRRNCNHVNSAEENRNELWECTAGYLFGNPYGYGGDGRDQRYGDSAYVNQNYYYQPQL